MWSLSSSEEISTKIRDSYKQTRHAEDENQPLSVQPWGRDAEKRRYFLIEGQDDTFFRVYRENHRYTRNAQWYNMAGNIEEVRALAEKLEKEDGSQAARTLSIRMMQAITRFEAGEEVYLHPRDATVVELQKLITSFRNAAVANTVKLAEQHSPDRSLDFRCTRAVLVARECGILTTTTERTKKRTTIASPMQHRLAAQLVSQGATRLLMSDPSTPPVVARSNLGRVESTVPVS